jgi:hypothetical protein
VVTENDVILESENNSTGNSTEKYNYGEALQKSFLYLEANRSGYLPANNRIDWRGDSALNDGADIGGELTGGYYDAGDHVKFGQPMAMTVATLAWGGIEFQNAYQKSGQWDELLDAVKWGTDYFLKAHVDENGKTKELYVQVGDGNADHSFWGSPEEMNMARPAFKIDPSHPGSDVAADTAAALASASMILRSTDAAYASTLLENAKELYEFADTYRGNYSDSVPAASPFYTSWSSYEDELVWGASWLYKATGDRSYLDKAENYYDSFGLGPGDWTLAADDKSAGAAILLAQESDSPKYDTQVENWLNIWINGEFGVKHTPGGLAWRHPWGSLALAGSTAFLAGVYNDTVRNDNRYYNFVTQQINYILGDNPRNSSYLVGFGNNYPVRTHHRGSQDGSWNTYQSSEPNQHILYGSLVGGPTSANDFDYQDIRTNVYGNEGGTSYNAPFMGALAFMYDKYGGNPLTDAELDQLPGISVGDSV